MVKKYVCIKKVLLDPTLNIKSDIEKYYIYFIIGNTYEFFKKNNIRRYCYYDINYNYNLSYEEICEFFISLESWRNSKINKILENE